MPIFTPNIDRLRERRNIKGLIKALEHEDSSVQTAAARALGRLRARQAVEGLATLLTHWDDSVQVAGAEALGRTGHYKAVPPLLFLLKERNKRVRDAAVRALTDLGRIAIDALVDELETADDELYQSIISAIVEIGAPARRAVRELFSNHNTPQRARLLKVFANISDDAAIDILIEALSDSQYEVREAAAEHLVELGSAAAPKLLHAAQNDENDPRTMLELLSRIGNPLCEEYFLENLRSDSAEERRLAAEGLDKMKWAVTVSENGAWYCIAKQRWDSLVKIGTAALGPLGQVVDDANEKVRNGAIEALSQIGRSSWDGLIKSVSDPNPEMRLIAVAGLSKLNDKRSLVPLNRCLMDSEVRVRRAAVDALGQLDDDRRINPLIMALKDEDSIVRRKAVRFVGQSKDSRAGDLFLPMLADPSQLVCLEAVEALVGFGQSVLDPLLEALKHHNVNVRRFASMALGRIGDSRATPPLMNQLSHSNWRVREAVCEALGNLKDKRAVNMLVGMLDDENEEVAKSAAKALGQIGKPAVMLLFSQLAGRRKANKYAVFALKEMGQAAIDPLINALQHQNSQVRQAAVKVLELLDWKPEKNESGAAFFIARQEWQKSVEVGGAAVDPLINVLDDDELWQRRNAAENLGKIGDSKAVEGLVASLEDKYWNVREAAANSLVKLGKPAVEPLVHALLSAKKDSFSIITDTLARIGDKRAMRPLIYLLRDRRQFVREAAARALDKMGALHGNGRCSQCGKPVHKSLSDGEKCPFCSNPLQIRDSRVA